MTVYYCSIGYTATPETEQIIPPDTVLPIRWPFDEEYDPWSMHTDRREEGEGGPPHMAAAIRPHTSGLAVISLEVEWENGGYARRHDIVSDGFPRELRQWQAGALTGLSWTAQTMVTPQPLAVLVTHASPSPQKIISARLQIAIHQLELPTETRRRVRRGTDPGPPVGEGA